MVLILLAVLPGLLRIGGLQVVAVNGHSMGQAVPDQSIVVTRRVPGNSLQAGDVVVFSAMWPDRAGRATNVVHRLNVIASNPTGLMGYTSGDANLLADPLPVDLTANQALVIGVFPMAGLAYGTAWAWPVLASIAAGLLILMVFPRTKQVPPLGDIKPARFEPATIDL